MISFIAAMDENRVIGHENKMPWHLPADLKHFKEVTSGSPIIMGRKTYEAIGRPLPRRQNIIVTNTKDFAAEGCEVVHSLDEAKRIAATKQEIFVIGGETLFEQFLPAADRMYLTIIHDTFPGDTYFPEWQTEDWVTTEKKQGKTDEKNLYPHTFITLERKH
ncbi:dihydrofolate reductase [Alteribacillus sp. YIM 98480]|uniref:dihydrofolate reductase n=1 Tax=Alteribacillus sp. YIM 98480 TaxID=2606599 RepID=UPI00131D74A4|nr:dihydrofolate reductase [Alteribacillus sp. YIM 98480]